MLAQITLIPTESKKLIAKAVANLDFVKKAATQGIIMMHPSSSTYFIVEEITGKKSPTNHWVCGVVAPKGTCTEMGIFSVMPFTQKDAPPEPGEWQAWWAIKDGKLIPDLGTGELLGQMKASDVYIKGVNAIDPQGNVGCLIGDPAQGGPLGRVLSSWRKTSFHLVFPVGLEKMIPVPIKEAQKEAKQSRYIYAMGMGCGLLPLPEGGAVTEIDAIRLLSGATAVPIAAGGLGGAEGAITLVIKGEEEQVRKAIDFVEQSKGAKLPQLRLPNCSSCQPMACKSQIGKHWTQT